MDMEPLKLLREIALDASTREVGGSLQIAKVYKSNRTEFFGITWPSSDSAPYFQGRKYNQVTKPGVSKSPQLACSGFGTPLQNISYVCQFAPFINKALTC